MPITDISRPQRRILASGRWFSGIRAPFQEALLSAARVVAFAAGDRVFERGDRNDGLYAVLDGAIRFGAHGRSGKELVAGLAEPPQWFGEVSLLDGGKRTHHARAETAATLAHVPLPAVDRWLAIHPADWRYIGQLAVHKLRVMFAVVEDAGLQSPRNRLIRCLLLLATAYGEREPSFGHVIHVSQERLGTMLSLSRQSINALLQDLEREELVARARGRIRILHFGRLLKSVDSVR